MSRSEDDRRHGVDDREYGVDGERDTRRRSAERSVAAGTPRPRPAVRAPVVRCVVPCRAHPALDCSGPNLARRGLRRAEVRGRSPVHRTRAGYGRAGPVPMTVAAVKRPALLTQVLAVNALLIAATVLAATVTVHLASTDAGQRPPALCSSRRSSRPCWPTASSCAAGSRRSSSSSPRWRPSTSPRRRAAPIASRGRRGRGGRPAAAGVQPDARRASRSSAPRGRERGPPGAGGRARPRRARPPRRGQPGADRRPPAPAGDEHERRPSCATSCARRRGRDAGDGRAAAPRARAAPGGARRPRARGGAAHARSPASPARRASTRRFTVEPGAVELGADEQIVVYRVVQEALIERRPHAGARRSRSSCARDGRTSCASTDDGCGFDDAAAARGLGLTGMRERARLAGGRLRRPVAPGRGTVVELTLGGAHEAR